MFLEQAKLSSVSVARSEQEKLLKECTFCPEPHDFHENCVYVVGCGWTEFLFEWQQECIITIQTIGELKPWQLMVYQLFTKLLPYRGLTLFIVWLQFALQLNWMLSNVELAPLLILKL